MMMPCRRPRGRFRRGTSSGNCFSRIEITFGVLDCAFLVETLGTGDVRVIGTYRSVNRFRPRVLSRAASSTLQRFYFYLRLIPNVFHCILFSNLHWFIADYYSFPYSVNMLIQYHESIHPTKTSVFTTYHLNVIEEQNVNYDTEAKYSTWYHRGKVRNPSTPNCPSSNEIILQQSGAPA